MESYVFINNNFIKQIIIYVKQFTNIQYVYYILTQMPTLIVHVLHFNRMPTLFTKGLMVWEIVKGEILSNSFFDVTK